MLTSRQLFWPCCCLPLEDPLLPLSLPSFLSEGPLPRGNLFQRALILSALVASLFALQSLVPKSSIQRLATIGISIAKVDLGDRVDIWREGIAAFSEHQLLGVGSNTFRVVVELGKDAHNSFLSVLVEVGLIGFVLFVIILAIAVYSTMRYPKWEARFWLTLLLVWAVGASVFTWEDRKPTRLFLSLVVVSANLSVRDVQSRLRSEFPVKLIGSTS